MSESIPVYVVRKMTFGGSYRPVSAYIRRENAEDARDELIAENQFPADINELPLKDAQITGGEGDE